jgi:putative membrane protein
MRLVICIDRDDDLGRKAGVLGPVVGRANVVEAATKLGTADPEDSDTNAMFAAVRLFDEISRTGDECEVVVLTGSPKVGVLSDRKVAEQFDKVLQQYPAKAAHLVSDGAEDEYLFPIISSRVRIDGVHRVYIRQAASLESTYFTVVRALKDPKLRAKTVLPLALTFLVLGLAAAAGVLAWGVIGLAILLGVYLIFWTFDIDEAIIDGIRSASTDVRQGSVAFGFGLLALGLIGVGFLEGYNQYSASTAAPLERVLEFILAGIIWWLGGAMVWETGRAIRRYLVRGRLPRSYPIAMVSIIGIGVVSYGIIYLVQYLEAASPFSLALIILLLGIGLALVIGAGVLQQYLRSRTPGSGATAPTG